MGGSRGDVCGSRWLAGLPGVVMLVLKLGVDADAIGDRPANAHDGRCWKLESTLLPADIHVDVGAPSTRCECCDVTGEFEVVALAAGILGGEVKLAAADGLRMRKFMISW